MDLNGAPFQDLVKHLIAKGVAITSTLTVFETFTPGRPARPDRVLDAMLPEARDQYLRTFGTIAATPQSPYAKLFPKAMAMELAFAKAGGTLVVGTDPTGYGGVVAGFSNQRAVELLVEAGFTPLEAIKIATLNGATYLGRQDRIGSIAVGQAGGPDRGEWRPDRAHRGRGEGGDRLQAGNRIRLGEDLCGGERAWWGRDRRRATGRRAKAMHARSSVACRL